MYPTNKIPLSVIRDLRCRHCDKFVTCGPVHVVPDTGSILCGRCRVLSKPINRNHAFERIATVFLYPCCYWTKHCQATLKWNQSIEHERECIFQSGCKLFFAKPTAVCRSDKKIPEGTEVVPINLPDDVVEQLKCLVCESYLSFGQVHLGEDGRNICQRCIISSGPPRDYTRNLSYERLASIAIFPCVYRNRGCPTRLKYGNDMWRHEVDCSYGQIYLKKKPSKIGKDGKERGVIQTHSGHIYGTITPHSALFGPTRSSSSDEMTKAAKEEYEAVIRKKANRNSGGEETDNDGLYDSQSMDSRTSSVMTPKSFDDVFHSRPPTREDDPPPTGYGTPMSEPMTPDFGRSNPPKNHRQMMDNLSHVSQESMQSNGFSNYDTQYAHMQNFLPVYYGAPLSAANGQHVVEPGNRGSFVKKVESFRVGNQGIIDEIKLRNQLRKKQHEGLKRDEENQYRQFNIDSPPEE